MRLRSSVGAAPGAEQAGRRQFHGHSRHVDGHPGTSTQRAASVQRPGHQFLAGARRPDQQHVVGQARNAPQRRAQFTHGRTDPQQRAQGGFLVFINKSFIGKSFVGKSFINKRFVNKSCVGKRCLFRGCVGKIAFDLALALLQAHKKNHAITQGKTQAGAQLVGAEAARIFELLSIDAQTRARRAALQSPAAALAQQRSRAAADVWIFERGRRGAVTGKLRHIAAKVQRGHVERHKRLRANTPGIGVKHHHEGPLQGLARGETGHLDARLRLQALPVFVGVSWRRAARRGPIPRLPRGHRSATAGLKSRKPRRRRRQSNAEPGSVLRRGAISLCPTIAPPASRG